MTAPQLAVMVTVPSETPVTVPLPSTVAMELSDDSYVISAPELEVATLDAVAPTSTLRLSDLKVISPSRGSTTVSLPAEEESVTVTV